MNSDSDREHELNDLDSSYSPHPGATLTLHSFEPVGISVESELAAVPPIHMIVDKDPSSSSDTSTTSPSSSSRSFTANDLAGDHGVSLPRIPSLPLSTSCNGKIQRRNSSATGTSPWPIISASVRSIRTTNPIRKIVDPIFANIQSGQERGDSKDPISLALGDPTASGNLLPCPAALRAVSDAVRSGNAAAAGYANACGTPEARRAVAAFHSGPRRTVGPDHVVVASGTSGALELALAALLDEGSGVLLVPQPGFPLYQVIAESNGATVAHYQLNPDTGWQCDWDDLERVISDLRRRGKTAVAMVVNNPSNPTGAVYSEKHIQEVVSFCDRHRLVVVADEVYGDLTFEVDRPFVPLSEVAAGAVATGGPTVPVITCSGLAKQFLVPGWRVGWCVFHDNVHGSLHEVEAGAKRLAQVTLGASCLAQAAVPAVLGTVDEEVAHWRDGLRERLRRQAAALCGRLAEGAGPAVRVVEPAGAMYAICRLRGEHLDFGRQHGHQQQDSDGDDDLGIVFCKCLLREENVVCLPGACFGIPDAFRVVFCANEEVLLEAADRIVSFCQRHAASTAGGDTGTAPTYS